MKDGKDLTESFTSDGYHSKSVETLKVKHREEQSGSLTLDRYHSDPVKVYKSLPEVLKVQLAKMTRYFEDDDKIDRLAEKIYHNAKKNRRNHKNIDIIVFRLAMLKGLCSNYFIREKWFPVAKAYDHRGNSVRLEKIISVGRHVYVVLGINDNEDPVVMKWYQSQNRNTEFEISIYQRLRRDHCITPWFSSSYRFWDFPVLVMEKLTPLDKDDDPYQVGVAVMQQLRYIHKFGIHNDLKPGNIMKRMVDGEPIYLIIDHGGVTTERLAYGYRRWIWSPKWTSQEPHTRNQVTTPRNDFIELGFTMKTLQNMTTKEKEIRSGFKGRLSAFMDRVNRVDKKHIEDADYEDLIKILQNRSFVQEDVCNDTHEDGSVQNEMSESREISAGGGDEKRNEKYTSHFQQRINRNGGYPHGRYHGVVENNFHQRMHPEYRNGRYHDTRNCRFDPRKNLKN